MRGFIFLIFSASLLIAVIFGSRQILPLTISGIEADLAIDYLSISLAFAVGQVVSGVAEEIELRHPNPRSISLTSKEDPSDEPVQPTLYVTRAGLEQHLDKNSSSDSPIK